MLLQIQSLCLQSLNLHESLIFPCERHAMSKSEIFTGWLMNITFHNL